jgi:hypothetical protein
VYRWFLLY